jgi:hypothetical protein
MPVPQQIYSFMNGQDARSTTNLFFYERARCPFHNKFILCGTGILPVLENGTTSQLT